jgi:hypothetical protein
MSRNLKTETALKMELSKVLNLSADLWNAFIALDNNFEKHQSDNIEMTRDIHDIQNRIYSIAIKNKIII